MEIKKPVSIILPTYNEKDNLPRLIKEIEGSIPKENFELVIVDDNSPDGTGELAKELQKKKKNIKLVIRENERGFATAIRRGIEESTHDKIIIMDTDLSHDAHTLPNMLKKSSEYDLIVASRFVKNGKMIAPSYRVIGSHLMNFAIRILLNSRIKDNTGGFLLLNKKKIYDLDFDSIFYGYGEYCIRLLYYAQKERLKIYEFGYTHRYRIKGESKTSFFNSAFKYLKEILKIKVKDVNIDNAIRTKVLYLYERFYNDYKIKKIRIQNFKIIADKRVHKPGESIIFFAKIIKNHINPDDIVLDIGTGCGVLAILLSKYAKKIIGIDINRRAVTCFSKNILLNNIKNIEARQSDMFENIKKEEKFDLIIMNPPSSVFSPIKKISDCSYTDSGNHVIDSFFKNIRFYTKQNSQIIIMYPQINRSVLEKFAKKYGFKFKILAQKKNILYKGVLIYQIIQ